MGKQMDIREYLAVRGEKVRGWYVKFEDKVGHYFDAVKSQCGVVFQTPSRRWSVVQDTGRIELCEDCKAALRREMRLSNSCTCRG